MASEDTCRPMIALCASVRCVANLMTFAATRALRKLESDVYSINTRKAIYDYSRLSNKISLSLLHS